VLTKKTSFEKLNPCCTC